MIRYILPLPKLLSIAAIYNDKGMLPSIGEITVEKGKTYSYLGISFENEGKPGVQAYTDENGVLQVGPISKLDDLTATTEVNAGALQISLTTGRLVPWWMKRRLRTNPFNANDQMCKKDDL